MHFTNVIIVLTLSVTLSIEPSTALNATENRVEKFLSIFSVVRFPNTFCFGTDGYNGTCLTSAECSVKGGSAAGSCASGFGVCCTIFLQTCGSTATLNNTYWQNPGFSLPYTSSGQCSLSVQKASSDICQLRLDFLSFTIANPDAAAPSSCTTCTQCLVDIFTVTGTANSVPALCGVNTNQHMYLNFSPGAITVALNMIFFGTTTSRYWNIRVAQIPCGTDYTAPHNCLQWFPDATGTITSFDYQFSATPAVQKLANQDYTICIRSNAGYCGIGYAQCTQVPVGTPTFLISDRVSNAAEFDATCTTDFLQIPCGVDTQSSVVKLSAGTGCLSRFCSQLLSTAAAGPASTVYSYRKPFELRFYTNSFDAQTTSSIGFCLNYNQQPCTTVLG